MIQNFDDDQLRELESQDDRLDEDYWYGYWESMREEEALERYYSDDYGNDIREAV